MRAMRGQNQRNNKPINSCGFDSNMELADTLNAYYLRFDECQDFTNERISVFNTLMRSFVKSNLK